VITIGIIPKGLGDCGWDRGQGLAWVQSFQIVGLDVGGQDSSQCVWVALLAGFLPRRDGGEGEGAVAGGMAKC